MHNRRMEWTFSTQQCHVQCMIRRILRSILFTCYYVRSRSYHTYGIWHHTAVNNVCKCSLLAIWHATRLHSFSFVIEVRGPTKNPEQRTWHERPSIIRSERTSVRVQQYHMYCTSSVRTRMIRTRYILRILRSHDTSSVSRLHTHWHASTSIAERGLVV